MALSRGDKILAQDFIDLKARIKAEMNRRNLTDSMISYAGADYDYTIIPAQGGSILVEHINKIVEPLNAIKPSDFVKQSIGDQIKAIQVIDTQLKAHEAFALQGSGTDCNAGCSGLCTANCGGTCTGCSGTCSGSCSGSCSSGCSGGCKSGCTSCTGCSGGCSGSCKGSCSDACSKGCSISCKNAN